jgi:hypothetical protein
MVRYIPPNVGNSLQDWAVLTVHAYADRGAFVLPRSLNTIHIHLFRGEECVGTLFSRQLFAFVPLRFIRAPNLYIYSTGQLNRFECYLCRCKFLKILQWILFQADVLDVVPTFLFLPASLYYGAVPLEENKFSSLFILLTFLIKFVVACCFSFRAAVEMARCKVELAATLKKKQTHHFRRTILQLSFRKLLINPYIANIVVVKIVLHHDFKHFEITLCTCNSPFRPQAVQICRRICRSLRRLFQEPSWATLYDLKFSRRWLWRWLSFGL